MALIDDFKARFDFTPADVDAAWDGLEAVWPCMYGGTYGAGETCTDQAILLLIAHLFYIGSVSGSEPSMLASSQSVGSVSVTNVVNQSASERQSFFSSTSYGQQFLLITGKRFGACFV